MENLKKNSLMKRQHILMLSLTILVLIIAGGYLYYRYEKNAILQEKYMDLKMIADLKTEQIVHWREERLANARILAESPFLRRKIIDWLLSKDKTIEMDILNRIELTKSIYNYEDVFLVSAEGNLLFGLDTTLKHIDTVTFDLCEKSLRDGKFFISEPYFCQTHNAIHLDIIAPVRNDKNVPVVVLVLRVNPSHFLYPYIQSWPTSSKTAETLILRKEGDSILYINELRHTSNSAMKLRIPLTRTETPAAQAVLGQEGICEGSDYRGVTVLADMRPVPGTSWFMIAKVDQDEIYAELKYLTATILIIAVLLLLMSGIGISWLFNNRQKNIYRKLLETGSALQDSQEEFRTTLYSIGDAVITTDINGCIRNMNAVAEKLTGWTEPDAAGRTIGEVFNIINEESRDKVESPVPRVLKEGLVIGLANHTLLISKDGNETPIADSGAPIRNEKGDITGVVLVFRDQAQERMAQKTLQESERKFRETVKYLDEGYYSVTTDGILLDHNQAFNRILGFDISDDMKGLKLPDFWQDPDERKAYLQELMERGSIMNYLVNAKKTDGEKIVVLANAHLVKDENNKLARIEGTFTDYTDKVKAEKALRDSEEKYSKAFQTSPYAITITRAEDGRFIEVNGAFTSIVGYTREEALSNSSIGLKLWENEKDREGVVADLRSGRVVEGREYQFLTKGGKAITCLFSARIIKLSSGTFILSSINDITGRKQVEDALQESEEKYRSLIERASDGIVIAQDNVIKFSNSALAKSLGYEVPELNGVEFVGLIPYEDRNMLMERYQKRLSGEEVPASYEIKLLHRNGTGIAFEINASVIEYMGKPADFAILRDITRRKQAEEQLENFHKILEQKIKDRTQELEAFSYSVSHDLRAPIRAIDGFARRLSEDYGPALDEEGKRLLGVVLRNTKNMGQLIDDLLAFSRLGRKTMEATAFNMEELVKEVAEELKDSNKDRKLEIIINRMKQVYGDRPLIRQVIINLLSNSIKFTRFREKAIIEIGNLENDRQDLFYIKDNGVGFDMKYAHKIFDVFQRLHSAKEYEGTGIGLAIVQKIVQRHGGEIWTKAEVNNGATFYFSLTKTKE